MAHYAKLGLDNVVLQVECMDNSTNSTEGGIEKESIGIAHLQEHSGHQTWKKCSYNTYRGVHKNGGTPFRANYPGIGWYYNSEHDIFHQPRPTDRNGESCTSWTLNTTTGEWDAPITEPTLSDDDYQAGKFYRWDESAYQTDNTNGWFLTDPNVV